jgi:transcriptional regulator with XRE-family HTH domain
MAKLVAQEVSAARRANHLTVEQLARRTHLEPRILDGLEHGQDVALSILARVAHALGVHLELVRSRTRAPRPAPALTAAPASLRPLLAPLRRALAKGHDPMARHEVGEIIAGVKRAPDSYGMGAVVVLATAIGEDVPTLYRYASVAECWDRRTVRALLGDPDSSLTWSHLVLLARLTDDKQRAAWMRRIRRERLSVRQFEARLSVA